MNRRNEKDRDAYETDQLIKIQTPRSHHPSPDLHPRGARGRDDVRVAGAEAPAAPAVPFAVRVLRAHEGGGVGGRGAGRLGGGPASVVQSRSGRRSSLWVTVPGGL